MKLLPIDILNKSFKRSVMGCDANEVKYFLERISQELEALIHERNKLSEALREKELQLIEHKDRERVLKDTITTASQMSDKIKAEAQREANIIMNDAYRKADLIVCDARDSLKNTYKDISDLKRMKIQFESQMRAFIDAHRNLLDKQEQYLPKIEENEILRSRSIHDMEIK